MSLSYAPIYSDNVPPKESCPPKLSRDEGIAAIKAVMKTLGKKINFLLTNKGAYERWSDDWYDEIQAAYRQQILHARKLQELSSTRTDRKTLVGNKLSSAGSQAPEDNLAALVDHYEQKLDWLAKIREIRRGENDD